MGKIKDWLENVKVWFATREQRAQEKELREIEKAKYEIQFLKQQKEGLSIINQRDKLKAEIRKLKTKPDRFSISKFDNDLNSNYSNLKDTAGKKELPKIL